MNNALYASDKPDTCQQCRFWNKGLNKCRLGQENCYYLIAAPSKPISECDGCPFGRDHKCIGWYTKKLMREVGIK